MIESSKQRTNRPDYKEWTLWGVMFVTTAIGTAYAGLHASGMLMKSGMEIDSESVPLIVDIDRDQDEELIVTVKRESIFGSKIEQVVAFRASEGIGFWSPKVELESNTILAFADETLLTIEPSGKVHAFRYKDRRPIWKAQLPAGISSPCKTDAGEVRWSTGSSNVALAIEDGRPIEVNDEVAGDCQPIFTSDGTGESPWTKKGQEVHSRSGIRARMSSKTTFQVRTSLDKDWSQPLTLNKDFGEINGLYPVGKRVFITYEKGKIEAFTPQTQEHIVFVVNPGKQGKPKLVEYVGAHEPGDQAK